MTERRVGWKPLKESYHNFAPIIRSGHLTHKNYITRETPSNTFSTQWVSGQGYNLTPSNIGGIEIQNPDPVVAEPNEPWKPMASTGLYRPSNRHNVLNSLPKGDFFVKPENIPENYVAGVYTKPLIMPVYVPRRTNGAPVPKRSKRRRTYRARKN
jgi:hypothetical protein